MMDHHQGGPNYYQRSKNVLTLKMSKCNAIANG